MSGADSKTDDDRLLTFDGRACAEWRSSLVYRPTSDELAAYSAATRDVRPDRLVGSQAAPAYAFIPFSKHLFPVLDELLGRHAWERVIHLTQSFVFAAPIRPNVALQVDVSFAGLRDSPFGAVFSFVGVTTSEDGMASSTQTATFAVRGSRCVEPIGDPAGPPDAGSAKGHPPPGGTLGSVELALDADQAVRYAAVSGDRNPIHLDPVAARRAGFPSVIVHGICSLAMTCHALEALHSPDGREVEALRVSFARPVFPSDALTIYWQTAEPADADNVGLTIYYEVLNRRRRAVMRAGYLAFAP